MGGGGRRWSCDGAGLLSVPGRTTYLFMVGQRLSVVAVGADGVVWMCFQYFSFLSLSGRWLDID